jgi:polyisoprenoid-binding protein YceI
LQNHLKNKKIMKNSILSIAVAIATFSAQAQTTWKVDASHSKIGFAVSHLVISETEGSFNVYDGTVVSKTDDFTDAQVDFSVDANSINTESADRDKHLKGADFFDTEKFPKLTFKSTSFKKTSGNKYVLEGNLTIKDVTKKVKFDVTYNGQAKSPWGQTAAGFKATSSINRVDYGLTWNKALEAGGVLVGEKVDITLKLELIRQ